MKKEIALSSVGLPMALQELSGGREAAPEVLTPLDLAFVGDAVCSLDGGAEFTVSSWDVYCKSFNRANAACVARDLPAGEHTLALRLAASHAPESTGTALRIGAFLVL